MLPFSPPRMDQKILDEVNAALMSGWITTGPRTKKFEQKISDYTGVQRTVCVNSASAGLELMLRWFGVGPGDEVIVPAYTYCATANVVEHTGAKVVMVDVNASDFNMDVDQVAKKITNKTKVIIPVDFAGFPCDYDELNQLVNNSKVKTQFNPANDIQKKLGRIMVMSDAAHSFGGIYYGTNTGSLTDITVFSFHAVKNLSTAEGGAICLNLPSAFDLEELYADLCRKILHGQSKDALAKTQKGNWKYDVVEAGYKCNMTDLQAAIGLVELDRYDSETLVKRKAIFEFYQDHFKNESWAELPVYETPEKLSSYHLYPLRIKGVSEEQRGRIIQAIFDQDIAVNVHFQPLPLLSHYKNQGYRMEDYPVAYDNYAREISLPVYFNLTDENLKSVVKAVSQAVNQVLND